MTPREPTSDRRVNALLGVLTGTTPLDLRGRVRQLGRDLSILERRIVRGEGPPPVLPKRPRSAYATEDRSGRDALRPRHVRVTEVVRETPDAVSIYFEELDGRELPFLAGQFMTVELTVDGERLRRAYSLAGPSLPGARRHVTVKRVDGGRASNALVDGAAAGQTLEVLGPSGAFTLPGEGAEPPSHLVLVAGGSGITPIASLAETALARGVAEKVTLVFGNRAEGDVIFRARLASLAERHAGTFVVDHVLEEPADTLACTKGRLDAATTQARLDALGVTDGPSVLYFVCGPTPMMDAVREALFARGVAPARIREESFGRPEARREASGATEPQALAILRRGRLVEGLVEPGETLLEAGLRLGAPMPFSCAMGGCGACKVRLVEGDAVMDEPNCLSVAEAREGYVLACVAHAASPCRLEVP